MNDAELDALVEQFIARGDHQMTPQHFLPVMTDAPADRIRQG